MSVSKYKKISVGLMSSICLNKRVLKDADNGLLSHFVFYNFYAVYRDIYIGE